MFVEAFERGKSKRNYKRVRDIGGKFVESILRIWRQCEFEDFEGCKRERKREVGRTCPADFLLRQFRTRKLSGA